MVKAKPYQGNLTGDAASQLQAALDTLADGNPKWVEQLVKLAAIKSDKPLLWSMLKSKI